MPIGTGLAILGASALGAGASAVAGSKASKAAKKAADANNALQRDIYGQNSANLSPFMSRGNAAGDAINALLGLGGRSNGPGYQAQPFDQWGSYVQSNPDLLAYYNAGQGLARGKSLQEFGQEHYQRAGQSEGRQLPTGQPAGEGQGAPVDGATAQLAQEDAFKRYADSSGYKFQLQSGSDAISQSKAANGLLRSGSTLKALTKYGQDVGSTYFGNYLGALQGQQSTGLQGANALAGVGTNYANAVSGNNDSAASASGNAAINTANQFSGLLGSGLNALAYSGMGSSYGKTGLPQIKATPSFTPPYAGFYDG